MFLLIQQVFFVASGVCMLVSSLFSSMFVNLCSYVEKNWDAQPPAGEAERATWLNDRRTLERDRIIYGGSVIGAVLVIVMANLIGGGPSSMRILFVVGGFINLVIMCVRAIIHNDRKDSHTRSAQ